jgi:hypothetical protein
VDADSQIGPPDPLGVVADARARADETLVLAARHLDPSLVDVLRILGFDKAYRSARGSYLYDEAGRAYLDFHTGEGFASLGHSSGSGRWRVDPLFSAGRDPRRGALRALAWRT